MGDKLKKILTLKLLFAILGLVIAGEVVWAVWKLNQPIPAPAISTSNQSTGASLTLSTKSTVKVSEEFIVGITLDTGGKMTDGTDVIITFDRDLLEVVPVSLGTRMAVVPGTLYKDYPINTFEGNQITFSGLSGIDTGFRGKGVMGTVTFKALKAGQANINIEYRKGSTTDSNVTESLSAADVLIKVFGVTVNINP